MKITMYYFARNDVSLFSAELPLLLVTFFFPFFVFFFDFTLPIQIDCDPITNNHNQPPTVSIVSPMRGMSCFKIHR